MTDTERLRNIAVDTLTEWMSGHSSDDEYPQLKLSAVTSRHGAILFAVTDTSTEEVTAVKVSVSVEVIA